MVGAQSVNGRCTVAKLLIAGFDGQSKTGIFLCVFMGAIDPCLIRPLHQFLQGPPHLLRRAFKQTAATEGKQGVADEGGMGVLEMINDMAEGVGGGGMDTGRMLSAGKRIAFPHFDIDTWYAGGLGTRSHDDASG